MGQLQNVVAKLLDAFSCGMKLIKVQNGRNGAERRRFDSTRKDIESHLKLSLKQDRSEVQQAYRQNVAKYGPEFTNDGMLFPMLMSGHEPDAEIQAAEALSSLSAILFRLNAGFVSIIERFNHGKSTSTDYQALLNLSNASRMEAIYTFDQLSARLSESALSLTGSRSGKRPEQGTKCKTPKRMPARRHSDEESVLAAALAAEGWIRKPAKSRTASSRSSRKKSSATRPHPRGIPQNNIKADPVPRKPSIQEDAPNPRRAPERRKSGMSFASDSTKLGERPSSYSQLSPFAAPFYPIEPYRPPKKQRSRLVRFFTRQ